MANNDIEMKDSENYLIKKLEFKLRNLFDSLVNAEDSLESNCNYIKEEIEVAVDSAIEHIFKLRNKIFDKVDEYKQECLKKLKERENEKNDRLKFIDATQQTLKNIHSLTDKDIKSIEKSLIKEESLAHHYLDCYNKISIKKLEDFVSNIESISEIAQFDYISNSCILNVERLISNNYEYEKMRFSPNFGNIESDDIHRSITMISDNIYLVYQYDKTLNDGTEVIICNNRSKTKSKIFIPYDHLTQIAVINPNFFVFGLQEFYDQKPIYKLLTYNAKLELQKALTPKFNFDSLTSYNSDIYCCSSKESLIAVYSQDLELKYKIETIDLIESNRCFIYNGNLILLSGTSNLAIYNLLSKKLIEEILLNQFDNKDNISIVYIDPFKRFLIYSDDFSECDLSIFNAKGEQLFKESFKRVAVPGIAYDGRLILWDYNSDKLYLFSD